MPLPNYRSKQIHNNILEVDVYNQIGKHCEERCKEAKNTTDECSKINGEKNPSEIREPNSIALPDFVIKAFSTLRRYI